MAQSSRAVFLSYASEDAAVAARLAAALREAGAEVWFDQSELKGGDAWDLEIRRRIHDCALFVALVSSHTEARAEGYFRREWRLAVDRTLDMADDAPFLVPVALDATDESRARVPDRFRHVQWMRLRDGDVAPVVARIGRLLSGSPAPVAPAATAGPAGARTPEPATGQPPWRRRALVGGAVAALAVIAGLVVLQGRVARPVAPPAAPQAPTAVAEAGPSIAVLPFADLSEKKDQEYFSDGLAEELLDLLAKTPGLRVTARTSSFYYKGRPATVAEIAKALGVAHLLEGSVRKSGPHLRVTTQLIRTDTGDHVWSETYDRELKDVFQVQDEIAAAVVAALKLKLNASGEPGAAAHGTAVPEAYEQLLLGRQLMIRGSAASSAAARAAFDEAIRLDPRYAVAYAYRASNEVTIASATDDAESYREAAASAARALALDPALPEAFVARARYRLYTLDFAGARADADHVLALAPGDSRVVTVVADVQTAHGEIAAAIDTLHRAAKFDPLNRAAWSHLGNVLIAAGDRTGARRALERALALSPESEDALTGMANLNFLEGHPELAAKYINVSTRDPSFRHMQEAVLEDQRGHHEAAEAARQALVDCCARYAAYQVASVYAWRGDNERALDWLERARRQRDSGLSSLKADVPFNGLRAEPRYAALLAALKLPP
ncbi:MAG: TIR domain-containing protein [Proteobacteria bacterium]|nr:TIR domain-containing protein [Pseudomonadota bacterium]